MTDARDFEAYRVVRVDKDGTLRLPGGVSAGSIDSAAGPSFPGLTMTGTTGAFRAHNMTGTQRDALTPAVGMVVYNTTTSKLQVYSGGVWVDLH